MSNLDERMVVLERMDGIRPGVNTVDMYTTDKAESRVKSEILEAFSASHLKEIKNKVPESVAMSGVLSYEDYEKVLNGETIEGEGPPHQEL